MRQIPAGWMSVSALVAFVVFGQTSAADAGRRTLQQKGDLCSGVCLFSLCISTESPPEMSLCGLTEASMSVLVPIALADSTRRGRNSVRIKAGGAKAILVCLPPTAPCEETCAEDEDCRVNGPLSRCVNSQCLATPSCP